MSSRFYDEQHEFLTQRNGSTGIYSTSEFRGNGGILKNKDTYARPQSVFPHGHSFVNEEADSSSSCQSLVDNVLRPCIAEFLAVFVTVFLSLHVSAELNERHVLNTYKIALLSVIDGIAALIFISAFKTVHLHSAVTIAHLFCLTTSWYICVFLFIVQLFGSISAVFAAYGLRTSEFPTLPVVQHDISSDWTNDAYKLMLSQFIGTVLVVMSHVLAHGPTSTTMRVGRLTGAEIKMNNKMAISLFSLLQSTIGWNSMVATAIAIGRTISQSSEYPQQEYFNEHFVFWLGPLIASLTASFLYRLLYAPDNKKLACFCGDSSDRPVTV